MKFTHFAQSQILRPKFCIQYIIYEILYKYNISYIIYDFFQKKKKVLKLKGLS